MGWRKERKEWGDGWAGGRGGEGRGREGKGGTDTSLITSFLSFFFFFHESPLLKQQFQKRKCKVEA